MEPGDAEDSLATLRSLALLVLELARIEAFPNPLLARASQAVSDAFSDHPTRGQVWSARFALDWILSGPELPPPTRDAVRRLLKLALHIMDHPPPMLPFPALPDDEYRP
jgi:hypothetical protein